MIFLCLFKTIKSIKRLFFSLFAIGVVCFFSCKKDDSSNNISITDVSNTISSGSWRVSYYWDTNHEETSNYSGYAFTLAGGNAISAVKGSTAITGTWATGTDDSKVKLVLFFSSPAAFAEISDDWHVIERTDTKIRLQDVSGGNGGTDYLTLEKN